MITCVIFKNFHWNFRLFTPHTMHTWQCSKLISFSLPIPFSFPFSQSVLQSTSKIAMVVCALLLFMRLHRFFLFGLVWFGSVPFQYNIFHHYHSFIILIRLFFSLSDSLSLSRSPFLAISETCLFKRIHCTHTHCKASRHVSNKICKWMHLSANSAIHMPRTRTLTCIL